MLTTSKIFFKRLIIFFIFTILIFSSEFVYLYNNPDSVSTKYFTNRAKKDLNENKIIKSINNLFNLSRIYYRYDLRKTKKYLLPAHFYEDFFTTKLNDDFTIEYTNYINNTDFNDYLNVDSKKLSLIFYNLSLISNKHREYELELLFLESAVYIFPELSYYHLELANYWIINGDYDKAKSVISYCLNFYSPNQDCLDYLNSTQLKKVKVSGFQQETIVNYFKEERLQY